MAVFKSLPSPSLEDFTVRAAQAWRVGRKDWDNGAILFVFVDDRKMRIETGYGLEGALPDQLAARILDLEVRPRFRAKRLGGRPRGRHRRDPRRDARRVQGTAAQKRPRACRSSRS